MTERDDDDLLEIEPTWHAGTLVMDRYRLEEKLGAGGMGEVWSAVDELLSGKVAIKFLVGAVDREARRRFSAEVRAMARLDHPHIIGVLDQGEHDGAPLFVMNLVHGRSLRKWVRACTWEQVCFVFDQVLDALAYAHARGIVHRDLKPSNIIVGGQPDQPHAVVLDFGIAIDPWSDGLVTGEIVGSPGYMAPEQRRGETWRAKEGTDLFAFGILFYEALSLRSPFGKGVRKDDLSPASFLLPRARFPLRPRKGFEAACETFEPLLRRLMALSIAERPLLAADVREELVRGVAKVQREAREEDVPVLDGEVEDEEELDRTELLSPWHPVYLAPRATMTRPPPGSYGLYGLRQAPVHGRTEELKRLWKSARQAFAGGRPRVVVLEGIAGIGKSHLAQHLCERANERGLARFVEVAYLPQAPAASGFVPALEQLLRVRQAHGDESARARIDAWLADEQEDSETLLAALQGLLRPSGPGRVDASLKTTLLLRVLRVMCRRRAVIVLMNDVHWCGDGTALALLRELLDQDAMPVLALATTRIEEQGEELAREHAALLEHPQADRLSLGPLPEEAMRSLLRSYIALEPELENDLIERSEGLPLLATELLDELVHGGDLEEGTDGGHLRPGADIAALPLGMRSLWASRIERVATEDESGPYWVDALQGLALAKVELTRPIIEAAATASGESIDDAVGAWVRAGLLIEDRHGSVRFCHSEIAQEVAGKMPSDAAVRWNVIWSAALVRAERGARGSYGLERGLHLRAAGEPEEALIALLSGAEQAFHWGDPHRCHAAALEAEAVARDVRDRIRLAWALKWQGVAAVSLGKLDEAEQKLERARELFESERVLVGLGWTLESLGWALISTASYDEAVERCTLAAEAFRRAGDEAGLAGALGTLGYALARVGRYSEAHTVLREGEQGARRSGDARALARTLQGQAECARYQGDLEAASERYSVALDVAARSYQGLVPAIRGGLGLVALAQGDLHEAREQLGRALDQVRMEGQHRMEAVYSADLAAVALLAGDRAAAERYIESAEQGAAQLDLVDEHMQWALEHALTETTASSHPDLVGRAGSLAARLWGRLGRSGDATRVLRRLADLGVDGAAAGE